MHNKYKTSGIIILAAVAAWWLHHNNASKPVRATLLITNSVITTPQAQLPAPVVHAEPVTSRLDNPITSSDTNTGIIIGGNWKSR